MNISIGEDNASGLCYFSFNQDTTSLAVGTTCGYKLFSLNSVDKLELIHEHKTEPVHAVERLFSNGLILTVSASSPRKLFVSHFQKGIELYCINFMNNIVSVKLNRLRVVICLSESISIHQTDGMQLLHVISDTPQNSSGLFALSSDERKCLLAYPGSDSVGKVQIFDADNMKAVVMINAHNGLLAALAFNSLGTKLATASVKGTVIRVFDSEGGTKIIEFRRGLSRYVTIYSLSFSLDSLFLSASSSTETIHIFKLETQKQPQLLKESQGWAETIGNKIMSTAAAYLPQQFTDVFTQDRAFATVCLPFSGIKNICSLGLLQNVLHVFVASADGFLYIYNFDAILGGSCTLLNQLRFFNPEDNFVTQSCTFTADLSELPLLLHPVVVDVNTADLTSEDDSEYVSISGEPNAGGSSC